MLDGHLSTIRYKFKRRCPNCNLFKVTDTEWVVSVLSLQVRRLLGFEILSPGACQSERWYYQRRKEVRLFFIVRLNALKLNQLSIAGCRMRSPAVCFYFLLDRKRAKTKGSPIRTIGLDGAHGAYYLGSTLALLGA